MELLNQQTITLGISLFALVFGIYHFFREPQIKSDKIDALMKQHIEFLSQTFTEKFKNSDEKVMNIGKDLVNLRDNHVHTLETKVDQTNQNVNNLSLEVTRLSTIISERIPKKTS